MAASSKSTSQSDDAPIAFIDLESQQERIRKQIERAVSDVLDAGAYIMGPQVEILEGQLAEFCGAKHAISCSSGSDALLIALLAHGVGPGDAVICPGFTFTATPEAIALTGATCIFADVCLDTFNIDPDHLEGAMSAAASQGLGVKAIIAVDLFGLPADYGRIVPFAEQHKLFVICDAAQSFGASSPDGRVGTIGDVTATSFFPAKPLGCYGDGGALFADDSELADVYRSIRLHGKGTEKYDIVRTGINGRLDTIQAAILIEKLKIFADEIDARNAVAARYSRAFENVLAVPIVPKGYRSVWAQYTLRLEDSHRDAMAEALRAQGIPTAVYYPRPLHHQPAYRDQVIGDGGLATSERLCREVLSLPMHPYLTDKQQDRIISAVLAHSAE